jgi:hypothetical protein
MIRIFLAAVGFIDMGHLQVALNETYDNKLWGRISMNCQRSQGSLTRGSERHYRLLLAQRPSQKGGCIGLSYLTLAPKLF